MSEPRLKAKDYCECGCGRYGTLRSVARDGKRHVKDCDTAQCRVCKGRESKRSGGRRQAKAARRIGYPTSTLKPSNEEWFGGAVRFEVKSGAQVGPVWTRYLNAEAQSEAQRPYGDNRPFVFLASPDGTDEDLVVFRASNVDDVVIALAEQRGIVA